MDPVAEATALRGRIREANRDIEKRLARSHVSFQYDAEMDYLYVRFDRQDNDSAIYNVESANPKDTLSLTVEETTLAVIGMDFMRFREAYLATHDDARELFEPLLASLDCDDFRLVITPKGKWALYVPRQVKQALLNAA